MNATPEQSKNLLEQSVQRKWEMLKNKVCQLCSVRVL